MPHFVQQIITWSLYLPEGSKSIFKNEIQSVKSFSKAFTNNNIYRYSWAVRIQREEGEGVSSVMRVSFYHLTCFGRRVSTADRMTNKTCPRELSVCFLLQDWHLPFFTPTHPVHSHLPLSICHSLFSAFHCSPLYSLLFLCLCFHAENYWTIDSREGISCLLLHIY